MFKKSLILAVLLLLPILALMGCGGGGSETESAPAAAAPADSGNYLAEGTASIGGTITFEGQPPALQPIQMSADPNCQAKHDAPVMNEMLVLGDGQTMSNVLVTVKSGLPEGKWEVPSEAVTIDQKGCQYIPHVTGIMVGQTLKIVNSDGILHNVHAQPKVNQEFNRAMPGAVTEIEHTFTQPEEWFHIKCDVHPWMGAYMAITSHPFWAVTGKDGQFTISGLPAGTYEIEARHERLGTQTATVTVEDGGAGTQDFTFSVPK